MCKKEDPMPLRDHFRSPVDDVHSWDGLHAMWPAMIVQKLIEVLPEPYFAIPGISLGTVYYVGEGGVAVATYAPPKPTLTLEPDLPNEDIYEIRLYDNRRNRRLVSTIEILSPSNKDRPKNRGTFLNKVATLLKNNICVSIIDVVSTCY